MSPRIVEASDGLVRGLLRRQFPQWSGRPLARVRSAGTDNVIYRLGEDLAVRLPRVEWAAFQPEKEALWLPRLGPALPLATPSPAALGQPDLDFPWPWSICRWVEGEAGAQDLLRDDVQAARTLGAFVVALRACDSADGPRWGAHNHGRGAPLDRLAPRVAQTLDALAPRLDRPAAEAVWRAALAAPAHAGPGVWAHGDLHADNLVCRDGRLVGVIDFGLLGLGDPAADLIPAWFVFEGAAREAFLAAAADDAAMCARGQGWALYGALIGLDALAGFGSRLAGKSARALAAVLSGA